MKANEFLNNVCKEIKYKPAREQISEELEEHIEELKNENLCKGYLEENAEENAVEQMGDAKQIGKKLNKIHRPKLDWVLIGLIIILFSFRVILELKSYMEYINPYGYSFCIEDFFSTEYRPIKYLIMGLICGGIIYFFDYRRTKKWANLMYFTATMILIFQWINWYFNLDRGMTGCINMRLWNICIPLYIIAFAGYMANYKKEDFWDMIILYTFSCVLIYAQSGSITNTAILVVAYLTIIASKMLQNNKNAIKKVIAVCSGILCVAIIVMLLMTNIKGSLLFWGESTEEVYAYNGYWYENTKEHEDKILNNLKWIGSTDEQEELYESNSSHFRFLYIIGKLGIIPATILAVTIIFMCVRLIRNSKNIKDNYGKYLIIGLGTTYIVQSVIHILMNLNLWIRSDVNLPFVAEGDLYFLINCFTFAVILSVYRRKDINFEEPKKSKLVVKIEDFLFEEV